MTGLARVMPPAERPAATSPVTLLSPSPTSAEVAKRAGVSRTTVSFVLNNVRDRGISEATRQKVLATAQAMGYQPNTAARILAGGSSATVGMVIPKAAHLYEDVFIAHLVGAINEECHRAGLKMLIETTDDEGREPGDFVRLVRMRSIDGLIVANLRHRELDHLQQVVDAGIPLVVLGNGQAVLERFDTIGTNTYQGGRRLTEHLLDLGHERIAYVSFAMPEFHSADDRERGWRDALAARGILAPGDWVAYGDITAASGYRATQHLLSRGLGFTALFAGNDTIALGAMRALQEAGLRIPQDVALVGYDDIPVAAYTTPALTTMRSDPVGHGRDAMQRLLAQMRGSAEAVCHVRREAELIVRESCGALRRSDSDRLGHATAQ